MDKDLAQGLLSGVNAFLKIRERMPLRCVQAFLAVALHPGESVTELSRLCDLNVNTMSRNLRDIGERDRWGGAGSGLVVGKSNPQDARERAYYLTPAGEAMLRKILERLS